MVNSSERKQALVGWFINNTDFYDDVQLQKFLFFYECFSKINGDTYELEGLKGYKTGPVFSSVLDDIKCGQDFKNTCTEKLPHLSGLVNTQRAKLSKFLVMTLGNKLLDFIDYLNIWAVKRYKIERGIPYTLLDEADFDKRDASIFRDIEYAYPESFIDTVDVRIINGKAFVTLKTDVDRLTDKVFDVLTEESYDSSFDIPVHVYFSESGGLLLDCPYSIFCEL